jgi:hypothetical protein
MKLSLSEEKQALLLPKEDFTSRPVATGSIK